MPFLLDYVNDGDWERVRTNTDATALRLNPVLPQARVYNSANISHVTSGTEQTVTFNSELYDSGGLHSTSANTSRLTAPITGLYDIGASIRFASNATGYRYIYLLLNGATAIIVHSVPAANGIVTVLPVSTHYQLAAGDYVEVVANQTSGGALNLQAGAGGLDFWMCRLGGYTNMGVN